MTEEKCHRMGDAHKCPCCGSPVDSEAYFCTACRNYFCYHCRSRVLPGEETHQCGNQKCSYHGKLVCSQCDPKQQIEETPVVFEEPEDGYWPLLVLISLISGLWAWWHWSLVVWGALGVMAGVFAVLSGVVAALGQSVWERTRRVEHKRMRVFRTCLRCLQETKSSRAS